MSPNAIRPNSAARGRLISLVLTIAAIGLGALAACTSAEANTSAKSRVVYGAALALGNGSARVFVTLGVDKHPTSLGVSISESAMTGLPMTPKAPSPSAATLILPLPAEAKITGFDHVMLDWNPSGHEPEHVYTLPHFDFHFYSVSEADQMAIMPTAPDFEKRASRIPEAPYVPAGYVAAHLLMKSPAPAATIPMMGLHWIDGAAAELHGTRFTTTFLWGSYDGRFIFIEPMITKAHIESTKSVPGNSVVTAVKAPAKYDRAGYYPDRYSVRWDSSAKEYQISLDGLKPQK